jgi:hypothetical protein
VRPPAWGSAHGALACLQGPASQQHLAACLVLCTQLQHQQSPPKTLKRRPCRTVTKPPLPYPGEDAEKEAARISALPEHESQTWLLLEYCDKPCLQVDFISPA